LTKTLTIPDLDPALFDELERAAARRGGPPEQLARDLIAHGLRAAPSVNREPARPLTVEERRQREAITAELRDIRAMTVKPLVFDSTLIIREMRDTN
jgi:hypothetical protein